MADPPATAASASTVAATPAGSAVVLVFPGVAAVDGTAVGADYAKVFAAAFGFSVSATAAAAMAAGSAGSSPVAAYVGAAGAVAGAAIPRTASSSLWPSVFSAQD